MRRDWLKFLALLLPVLTGCLSHTRKLQQPSLAGPVLNADAVQLVEADQPSLRPDQLADRDGGFRRFGGRRPQGKQTDYTSIRGYMLFRKPKMLRVLSAGAGAAHPAFDLASDGRTSRCTDSAQEPRD